MDHSQRESSPVQLSAALEKRITDLELAGLGEEAGKEQKVGQIDAR